MRAFACGWGVGKSNFLPEPEPALVGPNHHHHHNRRHHHPMMQGLDLFLSHV